ncbi:Photoreceptor dehydrogenase [Carabus blaptoides fortunei]
MEIKGKIALVTGSATGIGLAYVTELLRNGAQHVTVADVQVEQGHAAVQQLNAEFGKNRTIFVKCDVTNAVELENAFKTTISTFNGLDIVINNAGILNDDTWELEVAINVTSVARGTMLGMKYMGKDKGGKGGVIVNIASILGLQAMAGCPIYVGTKHAVIGMSRSFGMPWHFQRTGVKVLAMCPGVTDTPLISEAGHRSLGTECGIECARELGALPKQPPANVAKGMMTMITKGQNGSVWVSEGNQPIYEVQIPDRLTLRKN